MESRRFFFCGSNDPAVLNGEKGPSCWRVLSLTPQNFQKHSQVPGVYTIHKFMYCTYKKHEVSFRKLRLVKMKNHVKKKL